MKLHLFCDNLVATFSHRETSWRPVFIQFVFAAF